MLQNICDGSFSSQPLTPMTQKQVQSKDVQPRVTGAALAALWLFALALGTAALVIKLPLFALAWTCKQVGLPLDIEFLSNKAIKQHLSNLIFAVHMIALHVRLFIQPEATQALLESYGLADSKWQRLQRWVKDHRIQLTLLSLFALIAANAARGKSDPANGAPVKTGNPPEGNKQGRNGPVLDSSLPKDEQFPRTLNSGHIESSIGSTGCRIITYALNEIKNGYEVVCCPALLSKACNIFFPHHQELEGKNCLKWHSESREQAASDELKCKMFLKREGAAFLGDP